MPAEPTPTSQNLRPEDEDILERMEALCQVAGVTPLDALIELTRPIDHHVLPVPKELGGFVLGARIGAGGMGELFRARNAAGDEAAVKLVPQTTPDAARRFDAECEALRKLQHPGIIRYRAHGRDEFGRGYLVMDLAEGISLESLLLDLGQPQPVTAVSRAILDGIAAQGAATLRNPHVRARLLRLLIAVADALHAAHDAGVIHGDLKPDNIMVDSRLGVKLVDFGLSRDLFRPVSVTRTSRVMGTLPYLAPEQVRAARTELCAATDTYALGAVLFRCLTGRERLSSLPELVRVTRNPWVLELRDEAYLPIDLQAILYRAFELDPRRRYRTALEMAQDLRASLGASIVKARRPSRLVRSWRRSQHKLAVVGVGVGVILALGWMLWPPPPCYVWADAINDGGELIIDGKDAYMVPHRRIPVSPGVHSYEYHSSRTASVTPLTGTFEIKPGTRSTRLNLLTHSLFEDTAPAMSTSRPVAADASFLLVRAPKDAVVTLDGTPWVPPLRWSDVRSGPVTLTATLPNGISETQVLTLPKARMNFVTILGAPQPLAPLPFRTTLGSLLSPLPAHVTLECDSGVAPFMNDFIDRSAVQPGYLTVTTCVGAIDVVKDAHATLRVQFPEPMRTISAYWNQKSIPPVGNLVVHYRTEGKDWTPADTTLEVDLDSGTRWFELRGTFTATQEPAGYSFVEFLGSNLDRVSQTENGGAFAIAAGPAPRRTR